MSKLKWTDEALLAEGRKYASRLGFARGSSSAYLTATRRAGILDQLYPSLRGELRNLSDANLLTEGRKYASRKEFERNDPSACTKARKRGLLDQLYPDTTGKWKKASDEALLAEGRKYASRTEFHKHAKGAYDEANRRNLLDLIYPEQLGIFGNKDNDAIYIWRAIGQHYNGNPVYKIGVTSARLGIARVEHVAGKAGFEFDLICCEPVTCKATDLERKLHLLGENPQFTGFDGCTEFRALSDSALYAAISMICSVTA